MTKEGKKEGRKVVKLQAKCKWAKILKPHDDKYGDQPIYSIALALSDAQFASLQAKGYKGKSHPDDDGVNYYNFKRKTLSKAGAEVPALSVIGRDKLPVTQAIGNGSEVILILELNDYDNSFGKGTAFRMGAVQVIEHVIFEASNPHLDSFEALDDVEEVL